MKLKKERLEELYELFNHRKFVHPDPLEFLYAFPDPHEREIAGLIAASLAYGRVVQILKSVSFVLERMVPSPRSFLMASSDREILLCLSGFRHRFTTGEEMAYMLSGAKRILEKHGSLYNFFMANLKEDEDTLLPALSALVDQLNLLNPASKNSLLPVPKKGSACKRLNLFLRWMVREDRVDPGGWKGVPPSKLIIPLDTHMYKICTSIAITKRKQADMQTAIEITDAFRKISPEDPVRYDFALTRLGIRKDLDPGTLLKGIT
jgi:uncharacterized protein (TIGR02757 family)